MPSRDEIAAKLDEELTNLLEKYRSLSQEQLECACTTSEVDGASPWSAKDHLAHLAMIERAFQGMIKRTLDGSSDPVGFDFAKSRDEAIARVHKGNQDNIEAHRDDDLDALISSLKEARAATRELLDSLSDEELARKVPGAPWLDGTVGGVLLTNAYHQIQHWTWVAEGLETAAAVE